MKIARVRLRAFRLRLRAALATARGPISVREGVLLALESDSGLAGYGESLPMDGFDLEGLEESGRVLAQLGRTLLGRDPGELPAILAEAGARAPGARAALAAVDVALHDLRARGEDRSLTGLLSGCEPDPARAAVSVNALVAGSDAAEVEAGARIAARQGYETLKLKIGAKSLGEDERRVAALRRGAGPRTRLRLDANGSWDERTAAAALVRLAAFGIEFVEQPVAAGDIEGMARLRASSPIAIAADEAATSESAAARVLESGAADLLVVKPSAAGGLEAAARIARRAREAGVGVVVTSFLDSGLGIAAALHFAVSLEGERQTCGLATSSLFERDLAPLPEPSGGRLALPPGPGLGVVPSPASLEACSTGPWLEIEP